MVGFSENGLRKCHLFQLGTFHLGNVRLALEVAAAAEKRRGPAPRAAATMAAKAASMRGSTGWGTALHLSTKL